MVVIFHRGSRWSRRHSFLMLGDWAIIILSQICAVYLRFGLDGTDYLMAHAGTFVAAALIYMLVFYMSGMYDPPTRLRRIHSDFLPLIVTAIGAGLTGLVLYARPQMTQGRGIWAISSLLILALSYESRHLFMALVRRGFFLRRALVLSDHPQRAAELIDLLEESSTSPYHILGMVLCEECDPANYPTSLPVLGRFNDLHHLIATQNVSSVLLSISPMRGQELMPYLRPLRYTGVEIMDYVSLTEELAREIPLAFISDEWLMTAALNSSVLQIRKTKRAMDVAIAGVGLVLGAPLLLIAGALIKLTSPGPIIYRQARVGLGGEPYILYKLRTMREDAEKDGAVWAQKTDRRVTRLGYYLRKWRLDEIPQLFNVIKGEMSLVGPRPERPEFTNQLAVFIPFYNERHLVQPGLTGWAQIQYPYAASLEAATRKLQYDLYYIKNMSFLLDVAILLKTFKTILVGLNHSEEFLGFDDKVDEWLSDVPPPAEVEVNDGESS